MMVLLVLTATMNPLEPRAAIEPIAKRIATHEPLTRLVQTVVIPRFVVDQLLQFKSLLGKCEPAQDELSPSFCLVILRASMDEVFDCGVTDELIRIPGSGSRVYRHTS